jgi:hypothetical protein
VVVGGMAQVVEYQHSKCEAQNGKKEKH